MTAEEHARMDDLEARIVALEGAGAGVESASSQKQGKLYDDDKETRHKGGKHES